jgi:hypothetical protein
VRKGTYFLESTEGWTSQHREGARECEEPSQSGERGERDKLETTKGSKRAMSTHFLESAEGSRTQESGRKRAGREHSRPGEHRGREKSKQRKKARERGGGHSPAGQCRWRDKA